VVIGLEAARAGLDFLDDVLLLEGPLADLVGRHPVLAELDETVVSGLGDAERHPFDGEWNLR
jgi:hypothetical protein